jgi:hypothetical protein
MTPEINDTATCSRCKQGIKFFGVVVITRPTGWTHTNDAPGFSWRAVQRAGCYNCAVPIGAAPYDLNAEESAYASSVNDDLE